MKKEYDFSSGKRGAVVDRPLTVKSLVESPWMLLITTAFALYLLSQILY